MPEEAAAATAASGDSIVQNLTNAFAAMDAPTEADTSAVENTEEPVETEETTEEPSKEAEPEAEAEEPEEEAGSEPEGEAEEADAEDEDDSPDILTQEEIEAKYARSNTKAARAYMVKVSELAKQGQETIQELGGEPFIEPLKTMSAALQEPTPENLTNFYAGITQAAGVETVISVLATAVHMGFTKADEWAKDPKTAAFGASVQAIVEDAVQSRFGVSSERLQKMAEWESVGWFDKLESWVENNYVDQAELDEMLEINTNPLLKKLAQENQQLKHKETSEKNESKTDTAQEGEAEKAFEEFTSNRVRESLNKVAWAKSPLRDIATDSAELKAQKQFFRDVLERDAIAEFDRLAQRRTLLEGYRTGHSDTSKYKVELAKALDGVINATKARTAIAEGILAKIYGKSRNANLLPKTPVTNGEVKPSPAPTETTKFQPDGKVKTMAEIQKDLERGIEAFG